MKNKGVRDLAKKARGIIGRTGAKARRTPRCWNFCCWKKYWC